MNQNYIRYDFKSEITASASRKFKMKYEQHFTSKTL